MTKHLFLLILLISNPSSNTTTKQLVCKQGQVSFFSYTRVENIKATNNTVYSIIDLEKKEIAISILMKAFEFEKPLMEAHFNESYIQSDIYPKATFTGTIENFDPTYNGIQTCIIKGMFTLRNIKKPLEVKTQFSKLENKIVVTGETELNVDDYNIKIPPILKPNIAKTITINFNLSHQ